MRKNFFTKSLAMILVASICISSNSIETLAAGDFVAETEAEDLSAGEMEETSAEEIDEAEGENASDNNSAEEEETLTEETAVEEEGTTEENEAEEGSSEDNEIGKEGSEEDTDVEETVSEEESLEEETEEEASLSEDEIVTGEDGNPDEEDPDSSLKLDLDAEGKIASGTSNDIEWLIDKDGKLFIYGSGAWENDNSTGLPAWCKYNSEILSAEVRLEDAVNLSLMFYNCSNLEIIDFGELDTSNVTSMSRMFYNCRKLATLNVSGFDTSNVTRMFGVFENCVALTELDVSGFDTSKVIYMDYMFSDCSKLTELDVSGFDTSKVIYMDNMFSYCSKLTELDVSGFDTSNVTGMNRMFYKCNELTELDVSGFDTSKVTNMSYMFRECDNLTKLEVSGFDTENVTDMASMFAGCDNLAELDVSGFDTSKVIYMDNMFSYCSKLTELDVSAFDTLNVTDMSGMFEYSNNLTELDLSGFDTSKVESMNSMFYNCSGLIKIDLSGFDTSNVTDMFKMFSDCNALKTLDLSGWDASEVTDMSSMFYNCTNLESVDFKKFKTSAVNNLSRMFYGCTNLVSVDLKGWDVSNVTNMESMFDGCAKLTSANLSGLNAPKVTNMRHMFYCCSNLSELNMNHFTTSRVTDMSYMFSMCRKLTTLDISSFSAGSGLLMNHMFYECRELSELKLFAYNGDVKALNYMFGNCVSLSEVDISDLNLYYVKDFEAMFYSCYNLKKVEFRKTTSYSKPTKVNNMFAGCSSLEELDLSFLSINNTCEAQDFLTKCSKLKYIVSPNECSVNIALPEGVWKNSSEKIYTSLPRQVGIMKSEENEENYNIYYVLNSGVNHKDNPSSYGLSETVSLKNPTRPGYVFDGWYDNYSCSGKAVIYVEDRSVILYASWIRIKYTIVYCGNGGKFTPEGSEKAVTQMEQKAYYDDWNNRILENQFVRKGYVFRGWNTKANGKGISVSEKGQIPNLTTKDGAKVKLYAQWSEPQTSVWLCDNADPSTATSIYSSSKNRYCLADVRYYKSTKLPANPFKRDGYTFKGWSLSPTDSTVKFKNKAKIKLSALNPAPTMLFAVWEGNKYTIKYDLCGSKGTVPKPEKGLQYNQKYFTPASVPDNASFLKEGSPFEFDGWSTKKQELSPWYRPGELCNIKPSKNNQTITLYAQWVYSFTISDNLTDTEDGERTWSLGGIYNFPQDYSSFCYKTYIHNQRPGYYIAGYNENRQKAAKGKVQYKQSAKYKNLANKTLYAVWKPCKYTIKFDSNAPRDTKATGKMSAVTATHDKTFTLKANAYKCDGYTFIGWSTNRKAKVAKYTDKQCINENLMPESGEMTLYAVWEKNN